MVEQGGEAVDGFAEGSEGSLGGGGVVRGAIATGGGVGVEVASDHGKKTAVLLMKLFMGLEWGIYSEALHPHHAGSSEGGFMLFKIKRHCCRTPHHRIKSIRRLESRHPRGHLIF